MANKWSEKETYDECLIRIIKITEYKWETDVGKEWALAYRFILEKGLFTEFYEWSAKQKEVLNGKG